MSRRARTFITAVAMLAVLPVTAQAQRRGRDDKPRSFALSNWTFEARGGLANFGRFLLDYALDENDDILGQRELDASNSFVWGGAVSANIMEHSAVRLGFLRTSADLNYDDDTGTDSNALDIDDIGGIASNVIMIDAIGYVLSERAKIRPYGGAGLGVVWWNLDPQSPSPLNGELVVAGTDNTLFKWGASGLLGVQFRPSMRFAINLEANTTTLGNPFTGKKSFITTTGIVIDEPTRVRQTNYTLGIAYTFGRLRRPVQADDR